jgi:multiple sugar transport system permease protein
VTSRLAHWVMLAPTQLLLVGFILLPSLYVAWLSLNTSSYGQATVFVGFSNYASLLTDPYFWRAFKNTAIVVLLVVHGELLLGLGMALLFAAGVPFPRLMVSIVLLPYAISEVVGVLVWKYMFEPQVGLGNLALTAIGLGELEWTIDPVAGLALVILLSIWHHLPFTFLILYAARLAVPEELYEAARMDGARATQSFRYITLPILLPAILVALLFRCIFAFRIFSEVWLLTGGGPARTTEVLAVYLYRSAFRYNEFGLASATGWAMVVLSLVVALYYLRLAYRRMFSNA